LLYVDGDKDVPKRWILANITVHDDYAGSLAMESPIPKILYRKWQDGDLC
jgi:hypothetical protein